MSLQNRHGRNGTGRQRSTFQEQLSDEEMLDVDGYEGHQPQHEDTDDEQAIGDEVGRVTRGWKKREEPRETQQQRGKGRSAMSPNQTGPSRSSGMSPDNVKEYMTPRTFPDAAFKSSMVSTPLNPAKSRTLHGHGSSFASSSRDPLDQQRDLLLFASSTPTSKSKPTRTYGGKRTMRPEGPAKIQAPKKPEPARLEEAKSTKTKPRDPTNKKWNITNILAKGFHKARESHLPIEWCYLVRWEDPKEEVTWERVDWMRSQVPTIAGGFEQSMNLEYDDGPMNFQQALAMMEAREQEKERKSKAVPAPGGRGRPRKKVKISVEAEED